MNEIEDIEKKIFDIIESLRPVLQEDDGDVEFVEYDKNKHYVNVRLLGNCKTCPLSSMTLQAGILRALKNEINEIERVMEVK
ncbi:MAG: NifU family protein [Candidatus Kapabacteria bacterium]|nr:NifU family protein [Candidatus Kapabacteria bacterium]